MSRLIDVDAAIEAVIDADYKDCGVLVERRCRKFEEALRSLPSAQLEQKVYSNMSDEEFEEWLYEHGVRDADIHAPIACKAIPLLIDAAIHELPSAQPEPICINLNESIKVKLTDWGKEIYYHQYDRTNQIAGREICKPKFPREDENGYTEFQLWCFIELYGTHIGMALPNVIEPLEIVYER